MTSFVYDSCVDDTFQGSISFSKDKFKVLLVGPNYAPDKRRHSNRSQITDEVEGNGYKAGGASVAVSLARDSGNDILQLMLGGHTFENATVSAKGAVYYKSRGGKPEDDELISYIDFEQVWSSLNGRFSFSDSLIEIRNRQQMTI